MSDFDFVPEDASDGVYGSCNFSRRFDEKRIVRIGYKASVKGRTGPRAAKLVAGMLTESEGFKGGLNPLLVG